MTSSCFRWIACSFALVMVSGRSYGQSDAPATDFGFGRPINPSWFPHDARQWAGYAQSTMMSDLAAVQPAGALTSGRRQKGKWKVLPYETESFRGERIVDVSDN